jgi:hypothetical protein
MPVRDNVPFGLRIVGHIVKKVVVRLAGRSDGGFFPSFLA